MGKDEDLGERGRARGLLGVQTTMRPLITGLTTVILVAKRDSTALGQNDFED
jgi:hypothetical protein